MTVPFNNLTTNAFSNHFGSTSFGAMTVTHYTLSNRVSARLAVLPFGGYGAVHVAPVNLTVFSEPGLFIQIQAAVKAVSQRLSQLFSQARKRKPPAKTTAKLLFLA